EQVGRVGLDRVLADEEPAGDLLVAEPFGDQGQDLELAGRETETLDACGVHLERTVDRHHDFLEDHLCPGQLEAKPDAQPSEERRDQSPIYLERVVEYEESILDELQQSDCGGGDDTVEKDRTSHAANLYPELEHRDSGTGTRI